MERFSPVRRGSEGSTNGSRTLSPTTPQQECQRLQRGLVSRSSPPRSIPGSPNRSFPNCPDLISEITGSPIHQYVTDSRHQISESSSPVHQLYSNVPESSSQENYQAQSNYGYESNRSFNSSPLHSGNISPYSPNCGGSPIHQTMYNMPNYVLYSGSNSPIINPLLSPNASPVFGGYGHTSPGSHSQPTSISSITQGDKF